MNIVYSGLFVFVFLFTLNVKAQEFKIGLTGGLAFNDVYFDNDNLNKATPLTGWEGGISSNLLITEKVGIEAEFLLHEGGFRRELIRNDDQGKPYGEVLYQNQTFKYLMLPILFKYETGKRIGIYLATGPYLSYLLKAKYSEPHFDQQPAVPAYKWDVVGRLSRSNRNDFNAWDFGILLESGMKVPIDDKLIFDVGVQLGHGVISIGNPEVYNDLTMLNQVIGLQLEMSYVIQNNQ